MDFCKAVSKERLFSLISTNLSNIPECRVIRLFIAFKKNILENATLQLEPIYCKTRIMRGLPLQHSQRKREPPLLSQLNLEKLGNNADGLILF